MYKKRRSKINFFDLLFFIKYFYCITTLKSFNAYPNPATDILNLEYTLNKATAVNLSVIDITGKEVARILSNEQQTEGTYQYQYIIDKTLAKGIYHIVLNYDKEVKVFKVVIQ